jgi:hypothetical protein
MLANEGLMNIKDWQLLKDFNQQNVALDGTWYRFVEDYISPGKILKFAAKGEWHYLPGHPQRCGPDGFLGLPLPDEKLMLPTSPLGALIGKLGGGSADQKDGTVFAIGSFALVSVPTNMPCTLFITINTAKGARIPSLERLELNVRVADP